MIPFLLAALLLSAGCNENDEKDEWIHLFNGENLDGWEIKISGYELNEDPHNIFRVEDEMLRVSYDNYDEWDGEIDHIFTEDSYSHYHFVVEYRFIGEQVPDAPEWGYRNNGIMMHAQPGSTMTMDQWFPLSVEMQLLGGDGEDERPNGNIYTPGTQVEVDGELQTEDLIEANAPTYHGDQWVRAETVVRGDSLIQHILDDEVVIEYTNPRMGGEGPDDYDPDVKEDGKPLTEGHIALQAETHPTDFRTVKLRPLEDDMDSNLQC